MSSPVRPPVSLRLPAAWMARLPSLVPGQSLIRKAQDTREVESRVLRLPRRGT